MSLFHHVSKIPFDSTCQKPILRSSICTGETVAGFKNVQTGDFEEIMVINNRPDLLHFLRLYNLKEEDLKKEY